MEKKTQMNDLGITVIIPVYNEEKRIERCIRSCAPFASRIIVMDNMSTDATCVVAESLGAEVYRTERTYKERLYWAMNKEDIDTKWIFYIDSDEEVLPDAAEEILRFCRNHENDNVNGLVCNYTKVFMGKVLTHVGSHEWKMRLFKKGKATFELNVELDEHMVLTEGSTEKMKNTVLHYSYPDMERMIAKLSSFAKRKAEELIQIENGEREVPYDGLADISKNRRHLQYDVYFKLPIGIRAKLLYWFYLLFKGGLIDGREGREYVFYRIYWYRRLMDSYYTEMKKNSQSSLNQSNQ